MTQSAMPGHAPVTSDSPARPHTHTHTYTHTRARYNSVDQPVMSYLHAIPGGQTDNSDRVGLKHRLMPDPLTVNCHSREGRGRGRGAK